MTVTASRGTATSRLFVLLARSARVGVIFRRGPSKRVLLVRWDLAADAFEAGQWLKGRIFERRCDLSPNGEYLLYFAASFRPPVFSWTALSRPPYLTALALWPKGDAWGGGGLFESGRRILLNHPESEMSMVEGMRVRVRDLRVSQMPNAGRGEDGPIVRERMARDGWTLVQEARWGEHSATARVAWRADAPATWSKRQPHRHPMVSLRMRILGIHERQGPWYVTHFDVLDRGGTVQRDLGVLDWADWDANGDLLFALKGTVNRLAAAQVLTGRPLPLVDLSGLTFEERPPVREATQWKADRPRGVELPRVKMTPVRATEMRRDDR